MSKLQDQLNNLRESIKNEAPNIKPADHLLNTEDISDLGFISTVDYDTLLKESNLDITNIMNMVALQIVGPKAVSHEWMKEAIKFNVSKMAPLHNNIKILQNRINSTSGLLDVGVEDPALNMVLTTLMREQRENIRLATILKKEFEQNYKELQTRLETAHPELFLKETNTTAESPEEEEALTVMDPRKMNETLAMLKEKANKSINK
jgi:hypothetical protein